MFQVSRLHQTYRKRRWRHFLSPFFFLPIGKKAIVLLALSTLEDPSIQALLLLYECLSKGAETTLYHGWWMTVEDTKHHSSL